MNAIEIIRCAEDEGITLTLSEKRLHLLLSPGPANESIAHRAQIIQALRATKHHSRCTLSTDLLLGAGGSLVNRNQALALVRRRLGDADIVA
ncbi:hypothetical protein [Azotobacter salinestris]|uniref:hypothetical protein n=1 Tax=Azotobacter salinestris TaxID=69964 RepID=UPI001266CA3A|nr:hypothetical protein [Azotobacter salinestris]